MYELTTTDQDWFERELADRSKQVYSILRDPKYAAYFEPEDTREAIYSY